MNRIEPQEIKLWKNELPETVQNAFAIAKKGYFFEPEVLFTINKIEWKDIASYPPLVSPARYLELKNTEDKKLRLQFPGGIEMIKVLLPNATRSQLFFYMTRKFLPENPNIDERVTRILNYRDLESFNQELIQKLYGGELEFIYAPKIYWLEKSIFTYDKFLNDPEILYSLLVELNVEMPPGEDIFSFVYYVLLDKINLMN